MYFIIESIYGYGKHSHANMGNSEFATLQYMGHHTVGSPVILLATHHNRKEKEGFIEGKNTATHT